MVKFKYETKNDFGDMAPMEASKAVPFKSNELDR